MTVDGLVDRLRSAGCVFAEQEAVLLRAEASSPAELAVMVEQRVSGLPLEQVVGWAEFCGLRVVVAPGVFVPRRRSEFVVRCAVAVAAPGAVVVDLGCGTGAVGAAISAALDDVELHAADVDPVSVACASGNLVDAQVYTGDLDDPLPRRLLGRVDVLVAVVPYVPSDAVRLMPPEARDHEPRAALDGGPDGLDVLRRLAVRAPRWLAPGGHLLLEVGAPQAPAAVAALEDAGLTAWSEHDGEASVVQGRVAVRGGRVTLPA